jgi:predicted NUDIX family phosphoesterase
MSNKSIANPKWEEIIIAAPRTSLFKAGEELEWQGLLIPSATTNEIVNHVLEVLNTESVHIRRGDIKDETPIENNAEKNTALKQPIPYGIVTSDDRDGELRVFVYERLGGGTESRLHSKLSIGVGGHMNTLPHSDNFLDVVKEEASRELTEELIFDSVEGEVDPATYPTEVIGLINDDVNEVGRVHIGILYTIETHSNHSVEVREKDTLAGEWMTLQELENNYDRLESWSQIALQALKTNA